MRFDQLIGKFNCDDIERLVTEYYPKNEKYIPVYFYVFGALMCCLSRPDGNDIRVSLYDVDGDMVMSASVHNKDGWSCPHMSFESWLGSEINFRTMEHFSDEEIFIRCLNAIVYQNIPQESCEEIVSDYKGKSLSKIKKKRKGKSQK